jgi:DNA-binding NarL/FixJ family response regulator
MLIVVVLENSSLRRKGIKNAISLDSDMEVSGEAECRASRLLKYQPD